MTIRIRVTEGDEPFQGALSYRRGEQSFAFDYERGSLQQHIDNPVGLTSLSIGTLQIEVALDSGLLLYAWGYYPFRGWGLGALAAPKARPGRLYVESDRQLKPGVSMALDDGATWAATHDASSATFCVRNSDGLVGDRTIEFAQDTYAELNNSALVALWLRVQL